jgi:hypothetical protein
MVHICNAVLDGPCVQGGTGWSMYGGVAMDGSCMLGGTQWSLAPLAIRRGRPSSLYLLTCYRHKSFINLPVENCLYSNARPLLI